MKGNVEKPVGENAMLTFLPLSAQEPLASASTRALIVQIKVTFAVAPAPCPASTTSRQTEIPQPPSRPPQVTKPGLAT